MKAYLAEFFGTFWLVLGGCGSAVLAAAFPGVGIGLCLTLIHLISIPVTNTSVNPARSTGAALFVGDWAVAQLWLFCSPQVGCRTSLPHTAQHLCVRARTQSP